MRTSTAAAVLFLALASSSRALAQSGGLPEARHVAAPASDITSGLVRLPAPAALATTSRAWIVPLDFAWQPGAGWTFATDVDVDARGPLALAILAPDATRWQWQIARPDGRLVALDPLVAQGGARRTVRELGEELPGWTGDRVDFADAPTGVWRVRITAADRPRSAPPGTAYLLARGASAVALSAHVTTLQTLSDSAIGLAARFEGPEDDGVRALAGSAIVEIAGSARRYELRDDGEHADGAAGDGTFGALLPPGIEGRVRARVELAGANGAGLALRRTVQLAFPVIERRAVLEGSAVASVIDDERLRVEIGAIPLGAPARLHVSAEVWGTDAGGERVPVCWISRMLVPEARGSSWILPLQLDGRWLDVASATTPLGLRNVRVQDPDTHVPHDLAGHMDLALTALPPAIGRAPRLVTADMLMGPAHVAPAGPHAPAGSTPYLRTLLLVHGYCSGGSIWPAADFTQPKLEFLDPNQNRTHDQFALLLAQAASAYASFGVVAHSQGGQAALHLLTYYTTGLDRAVGPRRIQSLGSPYQGTPLASLGFFACGVNDDMTTGGAPVWLAGIPAWARAEVFYWTTSDSGSACNFFAGLVLDDPEDGTTEMWRGQLVGGNSMGHVVGWCHTTGMSNPAQYTDHALNMQRNAQAAR